MVRKDHSILIITLLTFLLTTTSFSQTVVDKNKGSHFHTKNGYMDGNLVATVYYNFGEIADWENFQSTSGVWPKGTTHTYVDGVAIIVQAEAKAPDGKIIHPLETNYYEYTRYDVSSGVTYGWWPLPGYCNAYQSSPAQSNDPNTWPLTWPDRLGDWDGYWNGFFGKGVQNADVESFFVFDDNEDREYILKNNFRPDSDDSTRGGLGMQVKARGFQWSQVLAEDVIFWYYEITNMGTYDYSKALFAQYMDWGIGGHDNSSNNAGTYDEILDISYSWSTVPFGTPGNWSPVGIAGYAFLESPGISDDYKDNDEDGLYDERRDNTALVFIENINSDKFMVDPSQDSIKFREFYGYSWKRHWDADENANWRTYTDVNKDGVHNNGEALNDDVGIDGIGPYDEGYINPDTDGSEGNGKPDQGEPNFGILDKDESDQLGLTGFLIFPTHTPYDLDNDEENWAGLSALPPHGQTLVGVNLANFFSSYFIHLYGRNKYSQMTGLKEETGETERFSMSLIFALGKDDLFRRKKTVQQIYNANYRFAKPPEKPTIKALAGDGRVTIYWDDRAEKTFDAFYQKYNFEGYRIYRSTESNFLENKLITDAYGNPTYRKPLAQFDLIDNVTGTHPVDVNGALFYQGDDSGLQHSYIDSTVQNGQTYFYAVCAYDKGYTDVSVVGEFLGIPPSETTSIIKVDINGNYKTDINTAVVTPRTPAAGYVKPLLANQIKVGPATGNVLFEIVDPDSMKDNHKYRMEFYNKSKYNNDAHPSYMLVDQTEGDTLINFTKLIGNEEQTLVIDGFSTSISNDSSTIVDKSNTGWVKGNSNYVVRVGFDSRYASAYQGKKIDYPADFEIVFTEKGAGDLSFPSSSFTKPQPSNIVLKNLTENIDHFQFIFRDGYVDNKTVADSVFNAYDAIFIVFGDSSGKPAQKNIDMQVSWSVTFEPDTTISPENQKTPQPGDVFRISTKKPFRTGDYVEFVAKAPSFDNSKAIKDLDDIAVVPNPYVGAASWEPATATVGRGERRIQFIHLPAICTIRIYTLSGKLVQELEHNSNIDDGQEAWNLISRDGMDIAYGVYIYHVDAPGIGKKIDRFAIIK